MNPWGDLISNKLLWTALLAWLVAQVSKTILYSIINRRFAVSRLVGSGGMPSSHAATVCALTTASAFEYGFQSFQFAVTLILATIVIYDARGVRLETGKQASVIKSILETLETENKLVIPKMELQELVGHTPFQVLIGSILGIAIACLSYLTPA